MSATDGGGWGDGDGDDDGCEEEGSIGCGGIGRVAVNKPEVVGKCASVDWRDCDTARWSGGLAGGDTARPLPLALPFIVGRGDGDDEDDPFDTRTSPGGPTLRLLPLLGATLLTTRGPSGARPPLRGARRLSPSVQLALIIATAPGLPLPERPPLLLLPLLLPHSLRLAARLTVDPLFPRFISGLSVSSDDRGERPGRSCSTFS
jgi:hypothetical protein